jgi:hypothetical protein
MSNSKQILLSFIICFFINSSCKKSSTGSTIPPGNPNNEVKATVSINGSSASSSTATGNSTIFGKRFDSNGDTVITIVGGVNQGQIEITLVNTNSSGTYIFENNPSSRQYALCYFSIGNPLTGPYELYMATTGSRPGTITIDNLTSTSIKGSFTSDCVGSGGTIQIRNGSFKGEF